MAVSSFRALTSALLARTNLGNLSGITFGGKRDLYRALGYQVVLYPKDYRFRYLRNAIANRVVEAFPRACWRDDVDVYEDEDEKVTTKFETAWADLSERLHIQSMFQRVDIVAGLGRFGLLLIGAS